MYIYEYIFCCVILLKNILTYSSIIQVKENIRSGRSSVIFNIKSGK